MSNWEHRWPEWEPAPESGHPAERGGCTEDRAYDAGLIREREGWRQEIQFYDPRLDPQAAEYSPEYADALAFEEPDPESARQMKPYEGWDSRRPRPDREPPDWDREAI